jgi:hypothetical protein
MGLHSVAAEDAKFSYYPGWGLLGSKRLRLSIKRTESRHKVSREHYRCIDLRGRLMKFAILPLVLLFATSAVRATNIGMTMLREAAILHDDQRIKSLIHEEVRAERRHDFRALKQAISALGKATDPLPSH